MIIPTRAIKSKIKPYLSDKARHRLGGIAFHIYMRLFRWPCGLLFDLCGGHYRISGCTLSIPKDLTSRSYRACFMIDEYEAEERILVCSHIDKNDSVLELGACLGIVSCVTNKLLTRPERHVVVEGNPFCIPVLHRNRTLNHCSFLIEHCAVGEGHDVTFYLHPKFVVGGSTQCKTHLPVRVPGRSLKELDSRHGPFSALIIDVEGAELEVFENSREVLSRLRLVIAELHEFVIGAKGVERCRQILRECGMVLVGNAGITEVWRRA